MNLYIWHPDTQALIMLSQILRTLLAVSAVAAAPVAEADCDLATLQGAVANYLTAQTSGSSSALTGLASSTTYTQNDKTADVKAGILSSALQITHNRSSYDTTQCATYTELIVASSAKPYVIGTQMRFTGSSITKMQSLVTTTGDWLFNATGTLYWASKESWGTIPEAQRDTRATIQAAADAYLNLFLNKTVVVPWGTPCDRLEGGSYTGNGSPTDSCNVGVPSGLDLTNRRYVIDESVGAVDVFLNFGGATGLPDSHEFRVQSGKLRYVHTLTVMT
ncbi:hypothetical protein LSUE1_G001628 [Lachnellula suecica]|uniref:DUF8021 domain-containing protein n=1 Tax=Lachnellula suecica TaxID=602035 RepID=A0A8T9CF89_9HELO|nr:hypothetical protein LSUE1_G001628 [Lachnellula suecica]